MLEKKHFYSCACADDERGGLFYCRETEDGHIETVSVTPLRGTNYLCYSPCGKYLYATWNEGKTGGVAAYAKADDGTLTLLNKAESCGTANCHLTTSPDGAWLYCANYSTGNFAEFKLNADGSIGERTQVLDHHAYPVGPRTDRQEKAHTHCTRFSRDGKFLYVVDLGVDRIFAYPYTAEQGISPQAVVTVTDPGDGPRHIIFDKSGRIAYVVNELGNSVTSYAYDNGTLTKLNKYTTLPDGCDAVTKAAAIRLSPDEKFLYASNRGYESIACYRVIKPGELELFDIVDAHGVSPRDINWLPEYKYFTASNEFSDGICIYSFDASNGKLTYLEGHDVTDQVRPLCIEF